MLNRRNLLTAGALALVGCSKKEEKKRPEFSWNFYTQDQILEICKTAPYEADVMHTDLWGTERSLKATITRLTDELGLGEPWLICSYNSAIWLGGKENWQGHPTNGRFWDLGICFRTRWRVVSECKIYGGHKEQQTESILPSGPYEIIVGVKKNEEYAGYKILPKHTKKIKFWKNFENNDKGEPKFWKPIPDAIPIAD